MWLKKYNLLHRHVDKLTGKDTHCEEPLKKTSQDDSHVVLWHFASVCNFVAPASQIKKRPLLGLYPPREKNV